MFNILLKNRLISYLEIVTGVLSSAGEADCSDATGAGVTRDLLPKRDLLGVG